MINQIHHVEVHYDLSGNGATICFVRTFPQGKQDYIGRGYTYSWDRVRRVIACTSPNAWVTRIFKRVHITSRA